MMATPLIVLPITCVCANVLTHSPLSSPGLQAADTVQKADSGHPGAPMGCAPMAHLLFGEVRVLVNVLCSARSPTAQSPPRNRPPAQVMNFSPSNPKWHNRDRFVLSNGHACALQYT